MLGRPFIATTKPTVYMHYLAIKLSAPKFVSLLKEIARQCYATTMKVNYQIASNEQITNVLAKKHFNSAGLALKITRRAIIRWKRDARKKVVS